MPPVQFDHFLVDLKSFHHTTMSDPLSTDSPPDFGVPPPTQSGDGQGLPHLDDHPRPPTPTAPSTSSEDVPFGQRDSRFYIPYDLRIFHPSTLFTTYESLERERAGTSSNPVDPSEQLRQALELERWTCYWLCMRLRDARHENRDLQEANAKLEKYIEELERDRKALHEQLVAAEIAAIEARGTPSSSSMLRGVLRSRVVSRVSRAIRRSHSSLAISETRSQHGDIQRGD
jgi:hypothetical protein